MRWFASSLLSIVIASVPAIAEDNGPIIIPEQLQRVALDYPVANRLNINWSDAKPDDTGRYLGLLAAANTMANKIAQYGDRKDPSENDFRAAMVIACFFPPNKPPVVEPFWDAMMPAFYNQEVRLKLDAAVKPVAATISDELQNLTTDPEAVIARVSKLLPENEQEYSEQVLDLKAFAK